VQVLADRVLLSCRDTFEATGVRGDLPAVSERIPSGQALLLVIKTDRTKWDYSQRLLEQVTATPWHLPAVGYQQPSWCSDGAAGEGVSGVPDVGGITFRRTRGFRKPTKYPGLTAVTPPSPDGPSSRPSTRDICSHARACATGQGTVESSTRRAVRINDVRVL